MIEKNKYGMRKSDMDNIKTYLKMRGVPPKMIDQIRLAFINDAVREAHDMHYDRIYAGIALALNRAYGYGAKRIIKCLHEFDDLAGYIGSENEEGYDWTSCMKELRDKTGLVVRSDEENRIAIEYKPEEEEHEIN